MEHIQKVKQLRIDLDAILKGAKEYVPLGREAALFTTHLQEGRMLLGDVLGILGEAHPYDGKTTFTPADTSDLALQPLGLTLLEKLANLRDILGARVDEVVKITEVVAAHRLTPSENFRFWSAMGGVYTSLRLARNWVGMLLAEERRKQEAANQTKEA